MGRGMPVATPKEDAMKAERRVERLFALFRPDRRRRIDVLIDYFGDAPGGRAPFGRRRTTRDAARPCAQRPGHGRLE